MKMEQGTLLHISKKRGDVAMLHCTLMQLTSDQQQYVAYFLGMREI